MKIQLYCIFIILVITKELSYGGDSSKETSQDSGVGIDILADKLVKPRQSDLLDQIVAEETVQKLSSILTESRGGNSSEAFVPRAIAHAKQRNEKKALAEKIKKAAEKKKKQDDKIKKKKKKKKQIERKQKLALREGQENTRRCMYQPAACSCMCQIPNTNCATNADQETTNATTAAAENEDHSGGFLNYALSAGHAIKGMGYNIKGGLQSLGNAAKLGKDKVVALGKQAKQSVSNRYSQLKNKFSKKKGKRLGVFPYENMRRHSPGSEANDHEIHEENKSDGILSNNNSGANDETLCKVTENTNINDGDNAKQGNPDRRTNEVKNNIIFKAIKNIFAVNSKQEGNEKSDISEMTDDPKDKFEKDDSSE